MAGVLVDGKRLLDARDILRTPGRFEVRAETKHREAFAAAVAFASLMKYESVSISTVREDGSNRESPDLLVSADEKRFDVEVVRVDETSATAAHLYEIQAKVAALLTGEPDLKADVLTTFSVDYAAMKALTAPERDRLTEELCDFFRERRWRLLPQGPSNSVFDADSIATRVQTVVRVLRPTYNAFLSFAQADGRMPYPRVISEICKKRKITYTRHHELWLVVEIADPRGPFTETVDAVREGAHEIAPFDYAIVYDPLSGANVIL